MTYRRDGKLWNEQVTCNECTDTLPRLQTSSLGQSCLRHNPRTYITFRIEVTLHVLKKAINTHSETRGEVYSMKVYKDFE